MAADYRLSERFGVDRSSDDDWFDVLLPVDTLLFVDPFLVYRETDGRWSDSHDRLIDFFNHVLELMMRSMQTGGRFNRQSSHYRAAANLLLFPEPFEFCLGYGDTPMGSGTGYGLRSSLLRAAETTIQLGIESLDHFEELVLFQDQIGPDRISDVVCNVLKSEFIAYTLDVIERHSLGDRTERLPVAHAEWNRSPARWENLSEDLLRNPFTAAPILLVPERFLRALPTVDPEEFWEYAWIAESNNIKGDFNYELGKGARRSKEIARLAARNSQIVMSYLHRLEEDPKEPYPLEEDPKNEVRWYLASKEIVAELTIVDAPSKKSDFCSFVEKLVDEFIDVVENRGLWRSLWNENGTKSLNERQVQNLFHAIMYGFCKSHDIDLSPESNAGSGPVDFKFSQGWARKAVVEVKLARNSKYWSGVRKQVVQYVKAENVPCGIFLSVQFTENDLKKARRDLVNEAAKEASNQSGRAIKAKFVYALQKPPASKL
jgi:hypothetical protein